MQLSVFDASIGLILGLWATSIGYGVVALSDDPVKNARTLRRFGLWFKIIGPALAVWTGITIVRSVA